MRKVIVVSMLVLTLALGWWFWIHAKTPPKPVLMEQQYRVEKSIPTPGTKIYIPPPPPPTPKPTLKSEIDDWLGIAGKASPLVTMILAILAFRRKK